MKVIRDDDGDPIKIIPLLSDWHLPGRCQIEGCKRETTTIVQLDGAESPTGKALHLAICEYHHDESARSDRFHYRIIR